MSFDDALETVVRVRSSPGGTDDYGDPIESTTDREPIDGCLVAPARSSEPTDRGRGGVVVGWTVLAPPGSDVVFTDQLEVRGVLCDVEGEVGDWRSEPGGVVINVTRAAG